LKQESEGNWKEITFWMKEVQFKFDIKAEKRRRKSSRSIPKNIRGIWFRNERQFVCTRRVVILIGWNRKYLDVKYHISKASLAVNSNVPKINKNKNVFLPIPTTFFSAFSGDANKHSLE
jgi:hypothetical protein